MTTSTAATRGHAHPPLPRVAALLGCAGGTLGLIAGLVELSVGAEIREWVGGKNDTTRLGLATTLLALVALASALALLTERAASPQRRLTAAAGLLVPGLICFTTVGRLWYVPGILLVGAGILVAVGLRAEAQTVAASLDRNWTALLTGVLAAFYVVLGATALGLPGALGVAGGVLVLVLVATRERMPEGVAVALLIVAAVPFAALTWWSVATPLIAVLLIAIGVPALRRRPDPDGGEAHARS